MLNGKIDIRIIDGRIRAETSLDPMLVVLCNLKVAIKLLEEQVGKKGSIVSIEGLVM